MSTEKEVVLTDRTEQDGENESSHVVKSKASVHPSDTSGTEQSLQRRESTKVKPPVKHGHLRVGEDGLKTYKKTPSSAITAAIQLGIGYSVGRLSAKPERDVLMIDFSFTEKVWFPGSGSRETPSHKFDDFRFKSYAPVAFRYFRDIFAIPPSGFLVSLSTEQLRELSNPGASGSLFFLSNDDNFIVKTVQHKEATFLQQLLPGYYMNLHQNPRTLLPKFFGLYCYQSGGTNIRLAVMNNLLPSTYKCHQKYDLKGSTFKRRASKAELEKKSPTRKDLDFIADHPEGVILEPETYNAVMKTIRKDVRVLESFKIMDYSMLLGIHNVDQAAKDREESTHASSHDIARGLELGQSLRRDGVGAALEAIQLSETEDERPVGGIPARNAKGERLILFIGIIDILQSYRMAKKLEHGWKSIFHDGDTVSVHKPSFYAKRFLDFVRTKVLTRSQVSRGPSKRKAAVRGQGGGTGSASSSGKTRTSSSFEAGSVSNARGDRPTPVTVRIDETKNEDIPNSDRGHVQFQTEKHNDDHAFVANDSDSDHDRSVDSPSGNVESADTTIVVGSNPSKPADDDEIATSSFTTRFSGEIVTLPLDGDDQEADHHVVKSVALNHDDGDDTMEESASAGRSSHVTTVTTHTQDGDVVTEETTTTYTQAGDAVTEETTTYIQDGDVVTEETTTTYTQDGDVVTEETHVTSANDDAETPLEHHHPQHIVIRNVTEDASDDGKVVTTTIETTTQDEKSDDAS